MKNYKVTYKGNSSKHRNFSHEIIADNEREAVQKIYAYFLNYNYFPQEDGSIKDCDGHTIASPTDSTIEFDGGCFSAEEIKETNLVKDSETETAYKLINPQGQEVYRGCSNGVFVTLLRSQPQSTQFALLHGGWKQVVIQDEQEALDALKNDPFRKVEFVVEKMSRTHVYATIDGKNKVINKNCLYGLPQIGQSIKAEFHHILDE